MIVREKDLTIKVSHNTWLLLNAMKNEPTTFNSIISRLIELNQVVLNVENHKLVSPDCENYDVFQVITTRAVRSPDKKEVFCK